MADLMTALRNADAAGDTAAARRLAQLIQQQSASAPQAAPDDSLTTGMANSVMRMAGGATDFLPTVTKAITGYENPRIQIPNDPDGLFGLGMPRFVDASDPRLEGATNPLGFEGNEFEKAADAIYAKQKSLNYQPKVPWEQVKADPSAANVLGFMGEAAVTSLPDMAAAMVSAPLYFSTYVAPIAQKRAENDGRTQVTPADLSYAAAASAGIATAERIGAKGIFSKGAGNVVTRPLKAGGKEAVTESIQNPLEYAAETVNTQAGFNPAVAADQAAAGFVGGAGAGTGIRGTLDATGAVVNAVSPDNTATDQEAAADLADRLQGIIVANNLNVKDIKKKSTKGAREAVDKAHIQIAEEMKQLRKDLKKLLNVEKLDEIDTVVDKVSAEAGARQARNKTKSTVGQQEFDATERLVGNTLEGQQLLKLYRQSNELTELHNQGYIGGLSQFTDQVSPFSSQVGYAPGSAAELPTRLLGTAAGLSLNPAYTAAQVGAVGAGRAVDALTGRRSVVRKYLQQNAGNQGVAVDPDAPSLRATTIQDNETRKAEEQALRELMLERDNPPKGDPNDLNPSPEYVMQSTTGLNRQDVDKALDIIEEEVPLLRSAVKGYRKMLRDGTEVPNLNFLIQEVKGTANRNPDAFPNRTAPAATSVFTGETPGYRRGIEANRQKIENIKRDVNADPNLSQDDKEIIFDALDDMGGNLGLDPRRTATGILDAAVEVSTDKIAVADYLNDYVKRVDRQQKQSAAKAKSEERPKARIHGLPDQNDIKGSVELEFLPPPTETPEDIGFPRRDVDVQFMKDRDTAYDLRNRLDSLLSYVFDKPGRDKNAFMRKIKEEGAKRITDPDGRSTFSYVNAGNLGDKPMSPEQVERLAPFLVDFLNFVQGSPTTGILGSFQAREDSQERVVGGEIEVVDIDQPIGVGKMHIYQFMDTLFHELGHSIEAKSNLRAFLEQLSYLRGPYDPKLDPLLEDGMSREGFKQAVRASKMRRSASWERLFDGLDQYEQTLGFRPLKLEALRQDIRDNIPVRAGDIFSIQQDAMKIAEDRGQIELTSNMQLEQITKNLYGAIQYLYKPAELGADAVALYMQKPATLKKQYPELAKMVRAAVNNSDVSEYISFHSLAGLLGAAGMMAAVQAAMSGEDDEERPGILNLLRPQGVLQQASI